MASSPTKCKEKKINKNCKVSHLNPSKCNHEHKASEKLVATFLWLGCQFSNLHTWSFFIASFYNVFVIPCCIKSRINLSTRKLWNTNTCSLSLWSALSGVFWSKCMYAPFQFDRNESRRKEANKRNNQEAVKQWSNAAIPATCWETLSSSECWAASILIEVVEWAISWKLKKVAAWTKIYSISLNSFVVAIETEAFNGGLSSSFSSFLFVELLRFSYSQKS